MKAMTKSMLQGVYIGVGIVLGISLSAVTAVVISGTVHTFSSGEILDAAKINENFATLKSALESTPVGTYCGSTAGTYTGSQVSSYSNAKALCETACSNTRAHMCTGHEIIMSVQAGTTITSGSWYSTALSIMATASHEPLRDCVGWTSNAAGTFAMTWTTLPSAQNCSTSQRIACCL